MKKESPPAVDADAGASVAASIVFVVVCVLSK